METSINLVMDRLFGDLDHEFLEIEALLKMLESAEEELKKEKDINSGIEKLKEWIGILYRISANQAMTFRRMGYALTLAIQFSESRRFGYRFAPEEIKKWDKVLQKLLLVRKLLENTAKEGLFYVERLPLSLDSGWKGKGEISIWRKFLNIPGYLLAAPYLFYKDNETSIVGRKAVSQKAYLSRGLVDVKDTISELPDYISHNMSEERIKELFKDERYAVRNLKIFSRVATKLQRRFKSLHHKCQKLYKDLGGVGIDQDEVFVVT